jgi:hypothetical protein
VAWIANLKTVRVSNDLNSAVNTVAAVHDGVNDRLSNNPQRQSKLILSRKGALRQRERLKQFVSDGISRSPNGSE